jgi:hypothetical protein
MNTFNKQTSVNEGKVLQIYNIELVKCIFNKICFKSVKFILMIILLQK